MSVANKYHFFTSRFLLVSLVTALGTMVNVNSFAQCSNGVDNNPNLDTQTCGWASGEKGSGTYTHMYVHQCRTYRFELYSMPSGTHTLTIRNNSGNSYIAHTSGTGTIAINWTATFTGWVRAYVNKNTCLGWQGSGTANSATLRYRDNGTVGIWRGGTSDNWNTATNWDCNSVPTNTTEVLIPAPCVNNPRIYAGTNANVLCIKIDGANGAALRVDDNVQNIRAHGTSLTGNCN